jgi:hypothetical protein
MLQKLYAPVLSYCHCLKPFCFLEVAIKFGSEDTSLNTKAYISIASNLVKQRHILASLAIWLNNS